MSFRSRLASKSARVLAIAAATVTMSAGLIGSAGAEPTGVRAPWPIPCDQEGVSVRAVICVDQRPQNGYMTCAQQIGRPLVAGHLRIWGPGGMRAQSVDAVDPLVCGHGIGRGQTCAEFMYKLGPGRYESMGLACKDV